VSAVVFLGPTLSAERARELHPGCEVRPPAGQGDVLRALQRGATRIGIVDGYFDQVPAVWHKEILYALERGACVLGAASMGALRAAELHAFGMIGVGRIFELFRDGQLEDDDEVALAHGPADSGYQPLSEAMVNLRDRLEAAVAAGLLEADGAGRLVARLKALPYPARSFARAAAFAHELALDHGGRLEGFLTAPHVSLKQRDAEALLARLAAGQEPPATPPVRVERTVFLERLRLLVAAEAQAGPSRTAGSERPEHERALLGLLAEAHADLLGLQARDEEVARAAEEFCAARGLRDEAALRSWLAARDLAPAAFEASLREEATVRRLAGLYGPELLRRVRRLQQLS
jgi:hypothetical protein